MNNKPHHQHLLPLLAVICALTMAPMTANNAYAQATPQKYIDGLNEFTTTMSALATQSSQVIGRFFDGKNNNNTTLEYSRLTAEAHKDYHPSEMMCAFGTFTRSIARSEHKGQSDALILNKLLMSNVTNERSSTTSQGSASDKNNRVKHYKQAYCNTADNDGQLVAMCKHDSGSGVGAIDQLRINNDIDYSRVVDTPLTLDVNFSNDIDASVDDVDLADTGQDVYMMARHLYWPDSYDFPNATRSVGKQYIIQNMRALLAMNSVAQNSFTHVIGDKARSVDGEGEKSGWNFMKAMMKSFKLSDDDIHQQLGDFPSYYAQMDVLAKKLYQNPEFYTNLYDTPANVHRISATLDAIELMQMRDHFKSTTRSEMLISTLLQNRLQKPIRDTGAQLAR